MKKIFKKKGKENPSSTPPPEQEKGLIAFVFGNRTIELRTVQLTFEKLPNKYVIKNGNELYSLMERINPVLINLNGSRVAIGYSRIAVNEFFTSVAVPLNV